MTVQMPQELYCFFLFVKYRDEKGSRKETPCAGCFWAGHKSREWLMQPLQGCGEGEETSLILSTQLHICFTPLMKAYMAQLCFF